MKHANIVNARISYLLKHNRRVEAEALAFIEWDSEWQTMWQTAMDEMIVFGNSLYELSKSAEGVIQSIFLIDPHSSL